MEIMLEDIARTLKASQVMLPEKPIFPVSDLPTPQSSGYGYERMHGHESQSQLPTAVHLNDQQQSGAFFPINSRPFDLSLRDPRLTGVDVGAGGHSTRGFRDMPPYVPPSPTTPTSANEKPYSDPIAELIRPRRLGRQIA